MNSKLLIIGLVIILGLAGVLVLARKPAAPSTSMTAVPEMTVMPSAVASPAETVAASATASTSPADSSEQVITMDAGSFYYSVKEIHATKGQKIKVIMTSKDMMHNFNIDELNVKGPLAKSGETVTMEFVADKVGTFEYYCSVGQHRKMGQVGKIIVE